VQSAQARLGWTLDTRAPQSLVGAASTPQLQPGAAFAWLLTSTVTVCWRRLVFSEHPPVVLILAVHGTPPHTDGHPRAEVHLRTKQPLSVQQFSLSTSLQLLLLPKAEPHSFPSTLSCIITIPP